MSEPTQAALLAPCDDCTGDGGRGHTLRGACMGAPCEVCGTARYLHHPDERCWQQKVGAEPDPAALLTSQTGLPAGSYVEWGVLALDRKKPYPAPDFEREEQVVAWAKRVLTDTPTVVARVVTVGSWQADTAAVIKQAKATDRAGDDRG